MTILNKLDQNTRPTLQQVRRDTSLTSRQLAEAAGVPLHIEYVMEIGGYITSEDALKVLAALSQLTNQEYTLEDINVNLSREITPFLK